MPRIILCILLGVVAIGCFIYTHFTAHQKGVILSNTYLWATKEERKQMNFASEYKVVTVVFRMVGLIFTCLAAEMLTFWPGFWVASLVLTILVIGYAIVCTIQKAKRQEEQKN